MVPCSAAQSCPIWGSFFVNPRWHASTRHWGQSCLSLPLALNLTASFLSASATATAGEGVKECQYLSFTM